MGCPKSSFGFFITSTEKAKKKINVKNVTTVTC